MKDKTSSFNRLFIYLVLTMFIFSPFIASVSAGKDYNSSISNSNAISKLKDLGLNETEREKILEAFDDEINAYENYNDATLNALAIMKDEGVPEETITKARTALTSGGPVEITIDEERKTESTTCYTILTYRTHKLTICIVLDALNGLVQASNDYNTARSNTIVRIKEAGVDDDAKIADILNALYEPIRAADAIYDTINQAMVDFPFLGKIFGNERMNVYIDDQAPFNIITSGGRVESLNHGEIENPTMRVYTDMGTIDQLIAGELMPVDALQQGKIRYEGVGFVNKIKFKLLSVVSGILTKFGGGSTGGGTTLAKKVVKFKAGTAVAKTVA